MSCSGVIKPTMQEEARFNERIDLSEYSKVRRCFFFNCTIVPPAKPTKIMCTYCYFEQCIFLIDEMGIV